jgi:protein-L-isoaspartate(D-aspartate) O-methyltransferase
MHPSFETERARMVAQQLAARGITDRRVLDAMASVPRHAFVPVEHQAEAYSDHPLHIGCQQTISQPYMVACMTEMLSLRATDRVLEIGTGSGYQTAVLAALAREVISIERHSALAEGARARIKALGYRNVQVMLGDGTLGWPANAPYDAILVTAACPQVPPALREQLGLSGRLVCPVGSRELQKLIHVTRTPSGFQTTEGIGCVFVPLIGENGWCES